MEVLFVLTKPKNQFKYFKKYY